MMKFAKLLCVALAALLLLGVLPFAVSADEGEVIYQNDFSDPATLADFDQHRVAFEIRDGALYVAGPAEGFTDDPQQGFFGWLIYNKEVSAADYQVDVDVFNAHTAAAIVARADLALVGDASNNHFAGYIGFLANDAKKGAVGGANPADVSSYLGNFTDMYGQSSVQTTGTEPGCNIHLSFSVKGDVLHLVISDPSDGAVLYDVTCYDDNWTAGTFGLRVRLSTAAETNIGNLYFDNLKVTALAGSKPAETAAPETKAPETAAPETKAPETKAAETKAPETKAPETKAPETKTAETKTAESAATGTKPAENADSKGVPAYVWAIVGVVAAAAVVCGVILSRKKK